MKSKMKVFVPVLILSLLIIAGGTVNADELPEMFEYNEDLSGQTIDVIAAFSNQEKVFEQFTEDTGINVEPLSMSSGEVLSRMRAEGRPMADVWFGGGVDSFIEAKNDGLLERYESEMIENIPEQYRDVDGYWVGNNLVVTGFVVNEEVLEDLGLDMPKTWEDLTDPQYEGEILMSDPAISGTNFAILASILQEKGWDEGWQFWEDLSANIPYFAQRGSEPGQKAALGEVAIGISSISGRIMGLAEENPIIPVYPEDGIPWVTGNSAIFIDTEKYEAAKTFLDWIYSERGQTFIKDINQAIVTRADIGLPEELLDAPLDQLMDIDLNKFGEDRAEILEEWEMRIGN